MAYTGNVGVGTSLTEATTHTGARWAYHILHIAFTVAPILAGLDKFFNQMTVWERYLAPIVPQTLHVSATTFMKGVGVVEIVAGLIVAIKPRIGAFIVALWMLGIIVNLAINPIMMSADPSQRMWDIALRDLGLMLGALALGMLAGDPAVHD